ncbi:MAG TPA: hypothetical protein VIJ38_01225, partial [Acidobacteriaceae bacterium]
MSAPIMTEDTSEDTLRGAEAAAGSASSADASITWSEANQRYLVAALSALRVHLKATLDGGANASANIEDALLDP